MKKQDERSLLEPFLQYETFDWADFIHLKEDILAMVEVSQSIEAFRCLLLELEGCLGKPLIIRTERNSFSPERCRRLVKHLGDLQHEQLSSFFCYLSLSEVTVKREENAFGHFIHWLRSVKRPVIMVFQGNTILPFMGVGLACDYRIATSDAVFSNENLKLDIPSGFGLLYLLPAYVGFSRAQSLVTMTEALDAEKALAWGLLDQTVTDETLETALKKQAKRFSAFTPDTLGCIKDLLNTHLPDYDKFLSIECKGIEHAFRREPWKRL